MGICILVRISSSQRRVDYALEALFDVSVLLGASLNILHTILLRHLLSLILTYSSFQITFAAEEDARYSSITIVLLCLYPVGNVIEGFSSRKVKANDSTLCFLVELHR